LQVAHSNTKLTLAKKLFLSLFLPQLKKNKFPNAIGLKYLGIENIRTAHNIGFVKERDTQQ